MSVGRRTLAASVCALGIGLGACEAGPLPSAETSLRRDSSGVSIIESSAPAWGPETAWRIESEPILSIGDIGGPWEEQFSYVRDVTVIDDLLVVTEGSVGAVRYYDLEGRHRQTIGRHGEGPGEFGATASMRLCWRSDGSVAVTDDSRSRLNIASADRRFVATVSLPQINGDLLGHRTVSRTERGWLKERLTKPETVTRP